MYSAKKKIKKRKKDKKIAGDETSKQKCKKRYFTYVCFEKKMVNPI